MVSMREKDWELGVDVKAEAERARSFDWKDDQPQLVHFALWSESRPRTAVEGRLARSGSTSSSRTAKGRSKRRSSSSGDSGYTLTTTTTTHSADETTPAPSTSYLPPDSRVSVGEVLDADREVCVKVLVGRREQARNCRHCERGLVLVSFRVSRIRIRRWERAWQKWGVRR